MWYVVIIGFFYHFDGFLELSKGNNIVQEVILDPFWYESHDADWEEKLGRVLGNLQSLKELTIENTNKYRRRNCEEPPVWETVGRVLRHVCQKIALDVRCLPTRGSEEAFASAIRSHPSIKKFDTLESSHFDFFGIIASALLGYFTGFRIHYSWVSYRFGL
jgi:hypothetical protein